jgi:hypothetical protein
MKKMSKDNFNRLLKQYKTLSVEKLEIENEILKMYESLIADNVVTISPDQLKAIKSLRERLKTVSQEMKKTDKKILKLFKES